MGLSVIVIRDNACLAVSLAAEAEIVGAVPSLAACLMMYWKMENAFQRTMKSIF